MAGLKERLGRPLRLGIVGGGPGSWIGRMHRTAAELDGWWRPVAGVFSSDPARSSSAGAAMGFDPGRSYGDVRAMLEEEKGRRDGIEAVAIMSPNDTHYPFAAAALHAGLDVIADKPVSDTFAQAGDLVARTHTFDRLFAITHAYAAYPMTRAARWLVQDGAIGVPRLVQVEYFQGSLASRVEDGELDDRLRWLLDPARSGLALVMSAIGCHAQHLACFVAGRHVARVCADVGTLVPGRAVVDYVAVLMELEGGVRGTMTVTQAAAGSENDIRLRVCGETGTIDWSHREPSYLRMAKPGEPVRVIGRGDTFLPAEILAAGRAPRGHPEGLREAFANIYAEVAQERIARDLGDPPPAFVYPRIEDGAHTMAFIEACLASQARGTWAEVARMPGAAGGR
jgi:predicted dehydrogenase